MEMSIVWTDKAKFHLRLIHLFYLENVSFKVAESIVNGLIDKVTNLMFNPEMGGIEPSLHNYPEGYRYLVDGNYKIIYWIDHQGVIISVIFDCRRNPESLKEDLARGI